MWFVLFAIKFLLNIRYQNGRSIVDIITSRYGQEVLICYRRLEKLHLKVEKLKLDIKFLETCIAFDRIPKFLNFKIYCSEFRNTRKYKSWQLYLLERELKIQKRKVIKFSMSYKSALSDFKNNVSFLDFHYFFNKIVKHSIDICKKVVLTHERKLRDLNITPVSYNMNSIFNLSSKILGEREKQILSLGLNFSIPFYKLNSLSHNISFERLINIIQSTPTEFFHGPSSLNSIANSVRNIGKYCFNLAYKSKNKIVSPVFNKSDIDVLRNLSNDDSIIITRPDKGRGVVLLDKKDYVHKCELLLNDKSIFSKVNGDILSVLIKLEDKLNRLLRKIKSNIGEKTYSNLFASGSQPGVMYCLPKVHKLGNPFRPIISSINTAGYSLAKFLIPMISPLTINNFTIENSSKFVKEITSETFPSGFTMASFDITSLFTNVPLKETTKMIIDRYNPSTFYNIESSTIEKLLNFATSESVFIFNNSMYRQIDGVAMGSPLGPTYANTFMSLMEEIWLDDCPLSYRPIYYKRYVDDTFLIFKESNHVSKFLHYLNSKHDKIKFTCELEKDNCLNFLDINLHKDGNRISTSIYRKPTFTGVGLSWFDGGPINFKINSIKTLLNRAYNLTSNYFNFHSEIDKLLEYFTVKNLYPKPVFFKVLKDFLYRKYTPRNSSTCVAKQIKYVKLPFYGSLSFNCRKRLKKILGNSFPSFDFRFVFVNNFKISSFFKVKDRIPDKVCSNICYKFVCPSCNARYVGCSTRAFHIRLMEHTGRSYRTGQKLLSPPFSAIREHSREFDHQFSNNNFEIIARLRTSSDSFLAEKILINDLKPELNRTN